MAYDYRGTVAASGDSAMWTDAHTSVAVPCILHAQPVGNYVESIPVSVFSLLVLAAGINLCFHLYYIGADARTQARKAPPANPTPDTVGAGKAVFLLGSTIGSAFGEFVLSWALVLSIAVSMCTGILIWGTMVPAPATALDTDDYNAVAQGGLGGLMCLVAAIAVFLFLPEPRYRSGVVLFGDPQDTDAGTPATGKHFPQDTNNSALSVSVGYIWSVHLAIMFPFWCMGWQVLIGSRQLSSIATTGALNLAGGLATLPIDFLAPLLTEIYRKVHRRHSQRFTSAGAIIAAILLLHVTSVVLFASALAIAAPLLPEDYLPYSVNGGGAHSEAVAAVKAADFGFMSLSSVYWVGNAVPLLFAVLDLCLFLPHIPSMAWQAYASHRYASNLAADRPVKPMLMSTAMAFSSVMLVAFM